MRTLLLIIFEIGALIGIPRVINELREALGEAPAVVMPASSTRDRQTAGTPAKAVSAEEVAKAQLLKDSLPPSARTVANLQAAPQAPVPVRVEPPQENAAASQDDDYLPPWMRGAGAPKREAKLAPGPIPIASAPGAMAAKPVKQVRHKRHRGERRWEARVRRSRHASRGGLFWAGF
jgi:hypothetical protein